MSTTLTLKSSYNHPVKIDLNHPIMLYDSTCQRLNNLLEIQDSQSEMSGNPPLLGDALSVEEDVLGCMCDSFRSWARTKERKPFFHSQ